MKKLLSALFCLVCISTLMAPALAWEFKMTGSMNWTYQFANQSGAKGFFGPYNVDVDVAAQTSNLNFWWGGYFVSQNIVTGKTGAGSYMQVTLDPVITINPGLKLFSELRIGWFSNPQTSVYNTQDSPGSTNAMSELQVCQFWATIQLPWGTFAFGKRPWKFGTGLQYDGSDALSTESLLLNSSYGPLDIGIGMYAHRPAKRCNNIPVPNTRDLLNPINTLDPYDLIIFGVQPYFNFADSGVLACDVLAYTVYNDGPMQAGILGAFSNYHIGPEGFLRASSGGAVPPTPDRALDSNFLHGAIFVKYNNGRFFFNSEAAWLYWNDRVTGPGVLDPFGNAAVLDFVTAANYASPLFYPPTFTPASRYTEQWRYMAEVGILYGSSRLSFLYAWSPGPDRRNGQLIDRQPAAFVWHPTFDTFLGNFEVFSTYSFIFTNEYGSGLNAYNLSIDGYLRDAEVLAARFDYAVATNLNLYGSFMYADRTSHGYGWGCLSPLFHTTTVAGPPADNIDGNAHYNLNGNTGNVPPFATPPNIPDTALGWEMDAGLNWELLEGFKTGVLVGYWQPGKWFSYACVDRSVPGWRTAPSPANNWGARPDKTIDSIIAGQVTMTVSF